MPTRMADLGGGPSTSTFATGGYFSPSRGIILSGARLLPSIRPASACCWSAGILGYCGISAFTQSLDAAGLAHVCLSTRWNGSDSKAAP